MRYIFLIALLTLVSCTGSKKEFIKAENALDAGREFIDASLKGDFKKAGFYMLADEQNTALLKRSENDYTARSKEEKNNYALSEIIVESVTDSLPDVSLLHFYNSFDKEKHVVRIIHQNNEWLVDFKYTFSNQ